MLKPILFAAALTTLAGTVFAHATLEQKEAKAGTTTKITLRVPHGCEGEATHTVRISLPEGFYAAKPMPKAGWTLSTRTGPYATPFNNHGAEMTQGVREVIWSGGHLEDAWYDEFSLRGTVGPDITPGSMMFFPAVQDCANSSVDWTDTTGSHDVPNPAPKLTVVANNSGGHGHDGGGSHHSVAGNGVFTLGDLTIEMPFTRATLPNAPVGGGFATIRNHGTEDDRLVGASSQVAGRVEIHEMAMQGDVMKMRELTDGLPIPAGATVDLKPGGFHLMLMALKQPLTAGEVVTITLTFERAGEVEVPFSIGAPNAKEHDAHMNHADHGKKGE